MNKSVLSIALLAASATFSGISLAETPTMYVGAYGGSTEKLMKEKIIPSFEAKK